jgi:hypothetical protein
MTFVLGLRGGSHHFGNILSDRVEIARLQPADIDHHVQHRGALPHTLHRLRHLNSRSRAHRVEIRWGCRRARLIQRRPRPRQPCSTAE